MDERNIYLNDDCLEHLFTFLSPKELLNAAKVCHQWRLVALCAFEKIHSFRYQDLTTQDKPNAESLNFPNFLNILQVVAPNLKHATVLTKRRSYGSNSSHTCPVLIRFNNFKYYISSVDEVSLNQLIKVFLSRTKSLETLNIDLTQLPIEDWAYFFQTNNKIEKLEYSTSQLIDKHLLNHFVSCFPSELKRVQLHVIQTFDNDTENSITQFLQKQTKLSEFDLKFDIRWNLQGIAAHLKAQNITVLRLKQCEFEQWFPDSPSIRSLVPRCINLTTLNFMQISLSDDLCRQIVTNCRSIHSLTLESCHYSESAVQDLMALPNLNSLHLLRTELVKPTRQLQNVKKLEVMDFVIEPYSNKPLSYAWQMLEYLPNLSSLLLTVKSNVRHVTEHLKLVAQNLIEQIHSRGMNIVLYYKQRNVLENEIVQTRIIKTTCVMPSDELFEIFASIDYLSANVSASELELAYIHRLLANAIEAVYPKSVRLVE